jgi:hypothetical protein
MVLATRLDQHNQVVLDNDRASAAPRRFARRPRGIAGLAVGAGFGIVATVAVILGWQALSPFRGTPAPPPLERFDAAATPLIDNETRRSLAHYPRLPDFKALALATNGAIGLADGEPDIERAKSEALRRCGGGGRTFCRVYAVGMDIVWPRAAFPLPSPRDLRTEPLDVRLVLDELPPLNDTSRKMIVEHYTSQPDHKALAMTTGAVWIQNKKSSPEEAIRIALERCSVGHMRPCLMLSVNGFLTIQIPKSRRVLGIFLPSTEIEIPDSAREQIAQVYQGREWRALARGANGSWHAFAGAPSEVAAIGAALEACSRADRQCRLYAVGNFRVSD